MIDRQSRELFHELDRAARSGDLEGDIELRLVATDLLPIPGALGEGDPCVAREAHRERPAPIGGHVQEDRGVRPFTGQLCGASVPRVALALPGVASHEQDVERQVVAVRVDDGARDFAATELVGDVDRADVPPEAYADDGPRHRGDDDRTGGDAEGDHPPAGPAGQGGVHGAPGVGQSVGESIGLGSRDRGSARSGDRGGTRVHSPGFRDSPLSGGRYAHSRGISRPDVRISGREVPMGTAAGRWS